MHAIAVKIIRERFLPHLYRNSTLVLALILAVLAVFSVFFIGAVVDYGKDKERSHLLQMASLAAASLEAGPLVTLQGSEADYENPVYFETKTRLIRLKSIDSKIAFIYLMGRRDDKVFFYVDAESFDSDDDAEPGEVYREASAELLAIFDSGKSFVEGPLEDKWGVWVSGIAPVKDPRTGEVLMVLGMDIDASEWFARVGVYRSFAIAICVLFALTVLAFYFYSLRIHLAREHLRNEVEERIQLEKQKQLVENLIRHDIRNPLNGVLGFVQMLKAEGSAFHEKQQQYLDRIEGSAHKILHLVNHHLDLDKIERGQFELAPEPVDVVALLQAVADEQTVDCDVDYRLLVNGEPPGENTIVVVRGMETLCYSLFANLLSNAVNAAEQGEVLELAIEESENLVSVSFSNRQPVPMDLRDQFFEKYKTSSRGSGYGLGTYSAWLMASAMEAAINLETGDAIGTSISIVFPRWR